MDSPYEEHEAYHHRFAACLEHLLAGLVNTDAALANAGLNSIWVETITRDY